MLSLIIVTIASSSQARRSRRPPHVQRHGSGSDVLTTERPVWNAAVCAKMGVPVRLHAGGGPLGFLRQRRARVKLHLRSGSRRVVRAQHEHAKAPCTGLPTVVIASTAEELFNAKANEGLDKLRAAQKAARGRVSAAPVASGAR